MTEEEIVQQLDIDFGGAAARPEQLAEQEYVREAGPARALLAGALEGPTFGFSDEILAKIDELTGATESTGYIPQERRAELLRQKFPEEYKGADIASSLLTGALLPVPGSLPARLALGAGTGVLGAAGRDGDMLDIALAGLTGAALPYAAGKVAGQSRRAMTKEATERMPELKKAAKEAAEEKISVQKAFGQEPEIKALREAEKAAAEAGKQEQAIAKSIFDEPAPTMTAERASQLQQQLGEARGVVSKAQAVKAEAAKEAGELPGLIAGAKDRAVKAQKALEQNRDKLQQLSARADAVGKIAARLVAGGALSGVAANAAEEIALIEAVEKGDKPSAGEVMDAAKTLMKLAD
jgi:hypothetical protein